MLKRAYTPFVQGPTERLRSRLTVNCNNVSTTSGFLVAFEFDRVQQDRRAFTHLPWASYIAKSGSRYPCAQALKLPGEERIRSNGVDRFDLARSHPS